MQSCDLCGNDQNPLFMLSRDGRSGQYDSFECAIQDMAERCAHCNCAILGHPVRQQQDVFCCQHCAAHR